MAKKKLEDRLLGLNLNLKVTKIKLNPKVIADKLGDDEIYTFPSGKVIKLGDTLVELDHGVRHHSIAGFEIEVVEKEEEKSKKKTVKAKTEPKKENTKEEAKKEGE